MPYKIYINSSCIKEDKEDKKVEKKKIKIRRRAE
jgi:Mn2+/Fe2+ NRAMP family transporter